MNNIEWSNVLLFLLHGSLMLGAAYAAAHADKWGWAVPALMTMASLSNAPAWGNGKNGAAPPPKPPLAVPKTDPAPGTLQK